jgi:DNA-binding transcriptional regulator YdaS (Cro superfamily)
MTKKRQSAVILYACEKVGGSAALARHLGIKRQAIPQWTEIPIRHVHKIKEVTGIPLGDLRPDVFKEGAA